MKRKNMMRRNLQQTIRKSIGRYLAIVAIIALGAGLFCGLRVTKVDMVATVQDFTDRQNMFDLQMLNTYGWTQRDVDEMAHFPGIADAEGGISLDALMQQEDGKDMAYKLISIPETVNRVSLVAGRMPSAPDECLADNFYNSEAVLGQQIHVSAANTEETLDALAYDTYTVVGLAATPLYLNMERGSTSIGTGTISDYFYIPRDGFDMDVFTEINLTLPGDYNVYTDRYDDAMDDMADELEQLAAPMADRRRTEILEDAEAEYADGLQEYEDGLKEYEDAKLDAEQQLADAEQELLDGEQELNDNAVLLQDARSQLYDAQNEIDRNRSDLAQAKDTLAAEQEKVYDELDRTKAELDSRYAQVNEALPQVQDGIEQMEAGLAQIDEGLAQIDAGLAQIDDGLAQMDAGLAQLNDGIAQMDAGLAQIDDALTQIDDGLAQIDAAIPQLEDALAQIDDGMEQLETLLPLLDRAAELAQKALDVLEAAPVPDNEKIEQAKAKLQMLIDKRNEAAAQKQTLIETRAQLAAQLEALRAQREELLANREMLLQKKAELLPQREALIAQRDEVLAQREALQAQKDEVLAQRDALQAKKDDLMPQYQELLATKATLTEALAAIENGYDQLEAGRKEADAQFADAAAQIADGEAQLRDAQITVDNSWAEIADNEQKLEQGRQDLIEGRAEYEDKKAEALQELDDAKAELDDAAIQLQDAREEIDSVEAPSLYALTRNTNLGYVVFESDSDIIAGIARIFPVFFLSVAALVCITTMTRMVDEERTQIGILKALGYSSRSIMGKYMSYSGSAAIIGCLTGVIFGSIIFPKILWNAYCIMYGFNPVITLTFDWVTYSGIVISYTALTLFVTWYCCHRELANVPAELIRPKAPAAGKKLLLEKLPFWKRLSFLNKVAIRNIFRYHQRLAMMLLGIGGCTALLVTGFGIKDSISGIVDYQFESVTLYDQAVTFEDDQTPELQEQFRTEFAPMTEDVLFCHESSIDLLYNDQVKNLNFLVSDEPLDGFLSLHNGETPLQMPGENEVLVSVGAATMMDIHEGDEITLRNAEQEELHVTVSGIFDNHVFNYVILTGDTLRSQWGEEPEFKTAYVLQSSDRQAHEVGAAMSGYDGVLNVSVNQDTANQVNSMMEAMDSIVLLVVFCAGLLATIVLYNLTNINIKERIREIATIKVLGFNARETGSYVFKENLALTFMGMILGLGGGKLLHAMVMSYVRIDMVWFDSIVLPDSYLWAALLTVLAALAVDFIMYFQLDKINMAEALKSVE